MDKIEFITILKEVKGNLQVLKRKVERTSGKQVQSKSLIQELEEFATTWFDKIEPQLHSFYQISDDIINKNRDFFGRILELSGSKPSKQILIDLLASIFKSFHSELIVPIQKHNKTIFNLSYLNNILSHASGLELDYLNESIECAKIGKFRAAIILGWCAAVNRLHLYIHKIGFLKFNQASFQMSAIQTGRYKRFNKKFDIQNLAGAS
jgi:hypothetical protein